MSVVLLFRSPEGQQAVTLDGPLIVGRDDDCDVTIDSVRLSRRHARFEPAKSGAEVTDLESRNGVVLDGQRVETARLANRQKVVMGDVSVTVMVGTAGAAAAVGPEVEAGRGGDSERTTLLPAQGAGSGPLEALPADRTMRRPPGDGIGRLDEEGGAAPPPHALPQDRPSGGGRRRMGTGGPGRLSGFDARLLALMLATASLLFAVVAVPLLVERGNEREAGAEARAVVLARLLASENERLLSAGARLSATLGPVADVGGVRAALVIGADGRVLAPVERLDEIVTDLPGIGDIRQIQGPRRRQADGMVEAAVGMQDGSRWLGVAWVRFDPVQAAAGRASGGQVIVVAFVLALLIGLAATFVVRRMVTSRLDAFAIEVELALGADGGLRTSRRRLPGLSKVIDAVEYMLERLRVGAVDPLVREGPVGRSPVPAPPERDITSRGSGGEGRLTLDAGFVVRGVDALGRALVGGGSTPIDGIHVLEAIPDQRLVTGIIDCVSGLSAGASASRTFDTPVGDGVREIVASRTADGQIQIAIHPA